MLRAFAAGSEASSYAAELKSCSVAGLFLSSQGEKSVNFYFRRVPLRKKVLKYGTPKPRLVMAQRAGEAEPSGKSSKSERA